MFKKYADVLSIPGALRFSLAGILARFPMALVGISMILMVRTYYGNYGFAGIVSGAMMVSFAIGAPMLARLVDKYGQAKVMLPSILVSAATMTASSFVAMNQMNQILLIVLCCVSGATSGSIGALVRSRWAFVTQKQGQIQAAYSLEAAFDELVWVMGPVIATFISTSVHPAAGVWLAAITGVVGSVWFLSQTKTEPPASREVRTKGEGSVMRNPAMIVLLLTYIATGAIFGANDLAVVAFATEHGAEPLAGAMLAVFSTGSLIGALVYGARTWKSPLWKLFLVGIIALAVGTSSFIFADSLPILGLIMLITGLVVAPTMTNVNTIVQRIMPERRLTEGLTWMATAMNIGASLGSSVSGPIIDTHGGSGGFLIVIIAGWTMALIAILGARVLRRETTKPLPITAPSADMQAQ